MLTVDPKERITLESALTHEAFNKPDLKFKNNFNT